MGAILCCCKDNNTRIYGTNKHQKQALIRREIHKPAKVAYVPTNYQTTVGTRKRVKPTTTNYQTTIGTWERVQPTTNHQTIVGTRKRVEPTTTNYQTTVGTWKRVEPTYNNTIATAIGTNKSQVTTSKSHDNSIVMSNEHQNKDSKEIVVSSNVKRNSTSSGVNERKQKAINSSLQNKRIQTIISPSTNLIISNKAQLRTSNLHLAKLPKSNIKEESKNKSSTDASLTGNVKDNQNLVSSIVLMRESSVTGVRKQESQSKQIRNISSPSTTSIIKNRSQEPTSDWDNEVISKSGRKQETKIISKTLDITPESLSTLIAYLNSTENLKENPNQKAASPDEVRQRTITRLNEEKPKAIDSSLQYKSVPNISSRNNLITSDKVQLCAASNCHEGEENKNKSTAKVIVNSSHTDASCTGNVTVNSNLVSCNVAKMYERRTSFNILRENSVTAENERRKESRLKHCVPSKQIQNTSSPSSASLIKNKSQEPTSNWDNDVISKSGRKHETKIISKTLDNTSDPNPNQISISSGVITQNTSTGVNEGIQKAMDSTLQNNTILPSHNTILPSHNTILPSHNTILPSMNLTYIEKLKQEQPDCHIDFLEHGYSKDSETEMFEQICGDIKLYNETNCKITSHHNINQLTIKECTVGDLIGPQHSYINQIRRITGYEVKDADIIPEEGKVVLELKTSRRKANQIRNLYVRVLKGKYYRKQAGFYNERRTHYNQHYLDVELENNKNVGKGECLEYRVYRCRRFNTKPKRFSEDPLQRVKFEYSNRMNICHKLAEEHYFAFCNEGREYDQIDLHYLKSSYEDEEMKRKRLLKEKKYKKEFPTFFGEAESRLDDRLEIIESLNNKPDSLEIIVGAGNNSKGHLQRIRPGIEQYLNRRDKKYVVINKGSLLLTIKHYKGRQPCFGWYYCVECNRSWCSESSWVGYYQKCYRCDHKCYSYKYCEERPDNYRQRKGRDKDAKTHQDVCGKCKKLGHDCRKQ